MTAREQLADLIALLERDADTPHPKYPSRTLLSLEDERVVKAIVDRVDNNQTLKAISSLPGSIGTGLAFILFEFYPNGLKSIGSDSFLAILGEKIGVVGVVDPFDLPHINQALPVPPGTEREVPDTAMPFALSRPSATETLRFSVEDLHPAQIRTNAFLTRIGGIARESGGIGGGSFPGQIASGTPILTQTVFLHGGWTPGSFSWVEYDYKDDEVADDVYA